MVGCQKKADFQDPSSNGIFSYDSACIINMYKYALNSAASDKWDDLNSIGRIKREFESLNQHKVEHPMRAASYDVLLGLARYWPIHASKGCIYQDAITGQIVDQNITSFKWTTYEDYLVNRFGEYQLDTICVEWRKIHNEKMGVEFCLPTTHKIVECNTDTSMSFHLELVDTLANRYYVPFCNDIIDISVVLSTLTFEQMAVHYGFKTVDTLWYDPQYMSWEDAVPVYCDSLDRYCQMFLSLPSKRGYHHDANITLTSKNVKGDENIYLYMKQHIIWEWRGQQYLLSCIDDSFNIIGRRQ